VSVAIADVLLKRDGRDRRNADRWSSSSRLSRATRQPSIVQMGASQCHSASDQWRV